MAKKAADIMTAEVVSATPSATVEQVRALLDQHHISGVPVLSDGDLVGIVTEANMIYEPKAKPVQDVMITAVVSVTPQTPVDEVAKVMINRGINRVPVLDAQGNLVGIVARANIVAAMAEGQ